MSVHSEDLTFQQREILDHGSYWSDGTFQKSVSRGIQDSEEVTEGGFWFGFRQINTWSFSLVPFITVKKNGQIKF